MIEDGRAGPTMSAAQSAQPTAEANWDHHPDFPYFDVLAGGPGSLAERSAEKSQVVEV